MGGLGGNHKCGQTPERVAQGGCGISMLGGSKSSAEYEPGKSGITSKLALLGAEGSTRRP